MDIRDEARVRMLEQLFAPEREKLAELSGKEIESALWELTKKGWIAVGPEGSNLVPGFVLCVHEPGRCFFCRADAIVFKVEFRREGRWRKCCVKCLGQNGPVDGAWGAEMGSWEWSVVRAACCLYHGWLFEDSPLT